MPAQHHPSFISTAEWNQFGERLRSRLNHGPKHVALSALIVRSLLLRWKRSSRQEDKHLIHLIEQLTVWEDRIMVRGCDVQKELNQAHSIFDPLLMALAFSAPDKKIARHDALVIRIQYDLLWTFVRDHPLDTGSLKKQRAWLTTHWKDLDQLLQESPCHCSYRSPDAEPPEPPI